MRQKSIVATGVVLAGLLFAMALAAWIAPARAASPFPVPSGTVGTITRIAGNIYTVDTGSGVVIQVRVEASTVIVKGVFATSAALRVGDRVVVDPSFQLTRPGPTGPGQQPGVRSSSDSASSRSTGDSNAGVRPGSTSGTGSTSPSAADPGTGQGSTPPSGGDPNAGRIPGSTASQSPGDTSTTDPGTRSPITARFIWVPQRNEVLTSGTVKSASVGKITLQAGTSTFTGALDAKTEIRRLQTVGGSLISAAPSDLQSGRTLLIVGTTTRNSTTITAKVVLIQPPAPGTR